MFKQKTIITTTMATKPVNSWLQILTKLVNWISKISNKKNIFDAYKSSNLMLQPKDHEKFISSFMQNKITKIIMLTIPIIESLISASISFLGWFLEELPVRFIPTCLFLLYKQLIRYTALAVALSLFNAESIRYWYIYTPFPGHNSAI